MSADTQRRASERFHAARALEAVLKHNRTIDWVARERSTWMQSPLERELVFGTIRHFFSLATAVDAHLTTPLRRKDCDVYSLMLVGAYQLYHTRIPSYAAIYETVEAARALKKPWARRLVNAILHKLDEPERPFGHVESVAEYPGWMIERINAQYLSSAEPLLAALTTRAPMTLRVNRLRVEPSRYREMLTQAGIAHQPAALTHALVLAEPRTASTLPRWSDGWIAVQDLGAQYAGSICAELLSGSGPALYLDACCAPGGKLHHLIERLGPDTDVVVKGLDQSARRLADTRAIGQRLGHTPSLIQGSAAKSDWWDGRRFGHILLDAPCSGAGTLRRNPDIKLLLQPSDLHRHQTLQLEMLNNLWRMVDARGSLLYCTCSIFQEENDDVMSQFLAQHQSTDSAAYVVDLDLPNGHSMQYGCQLLPTDPHTDGFYYSLLSKAPRPGLTIAAEH